jgi:hypothetical protein
VIADAIPLQWETDTHSERKAWSNYSFSVINAYFDQLKGAADIDQFCPLYESLTHDQQVMTWAQIFVGVAAWESSWNPVERTYEDQGTDSQTGLPVFSEGDSTKLGQPGQRGSEPEHDEVLRSGSEAKRWREARYLSPPGLTLRKRRRHSE